MSKRFGVRLWPWIALVALAALLAGGGAWLYFHWPARPVAVPGEADLVLRLAPDGKVVTSSGKVMHDPSTRDFKKLEDLFGSRRQEKYKPPPDFVDYTLFVDADPGVRWAHLYPLWQRAIRNGGVTRAVLRLPHESEEARITFPRRRGPPPSQQTEVLLAVRKWEIYLFLGPFGDPSGWPLSKSGFRVETASKRLGSFADPASAADLSLTARAAGEVKAELDRAGTAGTPSRVVLLLHSDTPTRQVVVLLAALDRAGVGGVEIAETRE